MLVLRRTSGQSITIGDNAEIIVKILRNEEGMVSVGVHAPSHVLVDRLEVFEKRLQALPSTDHHKSALLKKLSYFEKRLRKLRVSLEKSSSNDMTLKKDLYSSS